MVRLFIALIAVCYLVRCNFAAGPGPLIKATRGEVWPKPQQQQRSENFFLVQPHTFSFQAPAAIGCPEFLDLALRRYWKIIVNSGSLERRGRLLETKLPKKKKFWISDKQFLGILDHLSVELTGECASEDVRPELGDNESYNLTITATQQTLSASSIWGILRGLETFSQLMYLTKDALFINATIIADFPQFPHRGLLLDTSRHFQPLYVILQMLDAMSFNKFNVFHWHITDDQSFPYKSLLFPELSDQGAYHPVSKIYEQSDIQRVIEHGRQRGIRVVPEFDTPGHTSSWGVSHPELLTTCYANGKPTGELGPMDPTKNSTYKFLDALFSEVVSVFPDEYFHIGGDEVDFSCWKSNPQVTAFMKANNLTTYQQLEGYFIQNVVTLMNNLGSKFLVWEEVFVNGVTLPNSTVVHVWRPDGITVLNEVTLAGKLAIYSSCWYLDHLLTGGDWEKYYACDPLDFPGTDEQKKRVLGGEACMWAETVNEYNVMSRVWPRASAAAEKLWSSDTKYVEEARPRLEEHTCRMNLRGIQAEPPNGPGVCL